MATTLAYRTVAAAIALCSLASCTRDAGQPEQGESRTNAPDIAPDIAIKVGDGTLTMPDTIPAGWRRVRVTETGATHIVVFFRLPAESSESSVQLFLNALDSTANTPAPAVALGGPEIGTVGDVVLQITPGRYVVACVARRDENHRHASAGEARTVIAIDAKDAVGHSSPVATVQVDMIDFAYTGEQSWPSGTQLIRVVNNGTQDHQLRIARVADGVTLRQIMEADDPRSMMTGVAGVARMSAGQEARLPIDLAPGNYLLSCLVADPKSRRSHAELGMVRMVRVE
jgi:hypothetical protein